MAASSILVEATFGTRPHSASFIWISAKTVENERRQENEIVGGISEIPSMHKRKKSQSNTWEVHTEILHGWRLFIQKQFYLFAFIFNGLWIFCLSQPFMNLARYFGGNLHRDINVKYHLIARAFDHPQPSIHLGQLHTIYTNRSLCWSWRLPVRCLQTFRGPLRGPQLRVRFVAVCCFSWLISIWPPLLLSLAPWKGSWRSAF